MACKVLPENNRFKINNDLSSMDDNKEIVIKDIHVLFYHVIDVEILLKTKKPTIQYKIDLLDKIDNIFLYQNLKEDIKSDDISSLFHIIGDWEEDDFKDIKNLTIEREKVIILKIILRFRYIEIFLYRKEDIVEVISTTYIQCKINYTVFKLKRLLSLLEQLMSEDDDTARLSFSEITRLNLLQQEFVAYNQNRGPSNCVRIKKFIHNDNETNFVEKLIEGLDNTIIPAFEGRRDHSCLVDVSNGCKKIKAEIEKRTPEKWIKSLQYIVDNDK